MSLRTIRDLDFTGKRVLVRVDFNMSLDNSGDALDTYKLQASKETIEHILSYEGARVALVSHRGRPQGERVKEMSLLYLADDVERMLGRTVLSVCECVGVCVVDTLEKAQDREVILLENVRFHGEEKDNDDVFAQQLAAPFDIYVNEAFSVCHREHASVHAVTKHLPSYAGFWLEKEIENLSRVKKNPEHPAIAIIGGAKIDTKLPLIEMFEKSYDTILTGGRVAVEARDKQMTFSEKVVHPVDYAEHDYDIGEKTVDDFVEKITAAKTIVWNGPMGKFETPPFDFGTRSLAHAIGENKDAFSVVGGGESVQALSESGFFEAVSFVSTGGGAMLSFLSGEDMPGLEVLQ